MSEGYVELSKLVEAQISSDGKEAKLICQGSDGGEFDMLIPANAIGLLIAQLILLWTSPQLKATESHEPPLFVAQDLEVLIDPKTSALRISLKNPQGYRLSIGLYPEQTKKLYELLFREGKFDSEEIQ